MSLQADQESPVGAEQSQFGAPTEPGADRVERLLAGLNPPQRQAVEAPDGPLLVLAGAGSGKTRVLTHRVAHLLATGRARPGEILAITFTNKAAAEMRERVGDLIGRSVRAMWVTTFHSACARMLRVDGERLGYSKGFTIYDQGDSLRMVKRCLAELKVDPKRYPPRAVQNKISSAKNQLIDPSGYDEMTVGGFEEIVAEVFPLYEKRMLEANAMDFDDLLVRTVNVMELFEDVRERWRRTFRHVLVDEYQDTNHAQYRMLQLLAKEHGNLMVVGDEDQSVYSFRSADVRNILDFENDFPDAELIKLEQNYRSTQTILEGASAVVAQNTQRKGKNLWTSREGGSLIGYYEAPDGENEALFVADRIQRYLREAGETESEPRCAVLYRTNAQSRLVEEALRRYQIQYHMVGG
ncbi:MAG TPA: UvrD-helicase domain-containing protein, partial [Solirubrobacterales bacterium]